MYSVCGSAQTDRHAIAVKVDSNLLNNPLLFERNDDYLDRVWRLLPTAHERPRPTPRVVGSLRVRECDRLWNSLKRSVFRARSKAAGARLLADPVTFN